MGQRIRFAEHVLGQADDHGARTARHGQLKGAVYEFARSAGHVDAHHSLRQVGEGLREIDLLEGTSMPVLARDFAHEQNHGGGVLLGGMDADAGMSQPRPPGHERNSRATGQLGRRFGHIGRRRLMPTGHDAHRIACIVECVQHIQVALARHGINMAYVVCA